MAADLYQEWLEIPPGPRPPSHYALLGLMPFEADEAKIRAAAAARIRQIRKYSLKFPHESTKLLNEVATAEVCLTQASTRAEYDQQLRNRPAVATPVEPTRPAGPGGTYDFLPVDNPSEAIKTKPSSPAARPGTSDKFSDKSRTKRADVSRQAGREERDVDADRKRKIVIAAISGGVTFAVALVGIAWIASGGRESAPVETVASAKNVPAMPSAPIPPPPEASPAKQGPAGGPEAGGEKSIGFFPEPAKPKVTNPGPVVPPGPKVSPPGVVPGSEVGPAIAATTIKATPLKLSGGVIVVYDRITGTDALHPSWANRGKFYQVDMKENHNYTIELSKAQASWDPYLLLDDGQGNILAQDDDGGGKLNAKIVFATSRPRTCRIMATYLSGNSLNDFRLEVRESSASVPVAAAPIKPPMPEPMPPARVPPKPRPAPTGVVFNLSKSPIEFNASLTNNDFMDQELGQPAKFYSVNLVEGRSYRFEMTRVGTIKNWSPYLRLEDDEGVTAARDQLNGTGALALVLHAPRRTGVYRISASTMKGVGDFHLSMKEVVTAVAGNAGRPVDPGDPPGMKKRPGAPPAANQPLKRLPIQDLLGGSARINGRVGRFNRDGDLSDEYAFRFSAGFAYTIDVITNQFESIVDVLSPDGEGVDIEDVGTGGRNSRIIFRPEKSGVYHITISSLGNGGLGGIGGIGRIGFGPRFGAPPAGNGTFTLQITRGQAVKGAGNNPLDDAPAQPRVKAQDLTLVKNAARADDRLNLGETEKAFLVRYQPNTDMIVEVTSSQFAPRIRLTKTDGQALEGTYKDNGDNGRLVYRHTTAAFVHIRVSTGDARRGPFSLKLRLE